MCVAKDGTRIFKIFQSEDVVVAQQLAIDWINSIKNPEDEAMVVWISEFVAMLPPDPIPTEITEFDLRLLAAMGISGEGLA
jgi:hypothetical protein